MVLSSLTTTVFHLRKVVAWMWLGGHKNSWSFLFPQHRHPFWTDSKAEENDFPRDIQSLLFNCIVFPFVSQEFFWASIWYLRSGWAFQPKQILSGCLECYTGTHHLEPGQKKLLRTVPNIHTNLALSLADPSLEYTPVSSVHWSFST
jgi:hypothetical protein